MTSENDSDTSALDDDWDVDPAANREAAETAASLASAVAQSLSAAPPDARVGVDAPSAAPTSASENRPLAASPPIPLLAKAADRVPRYACLIAKRRVALPVATTLIAERACERLFGKRW